LNGRLQVMSIGSHKELEEIEKNTRRGKHEQGGGENALNIKKSHKQERENRAHIFECVD
jgi:hypothetical protein